MWTISCSKAATNLQSGVSGAVATNDKKGGGLGRVMAKYIDSTLCWEDLAWIRKTSRGLPIVLKGIQTAADARTTVDYGAEEILLSNHGGRSLDTTQPAILTLLEIHKQCPGMLSQLEIYVDGGIQRGTDILKALALGATAVGIERPYLYSLTYGQEGVEHLTEKLYGAKVGSKLRDFLPPLGLVPDPFSTFSRRFLLRTSVRPVCR